MSGFTQRRGRVPIKRAAQPEEDLVRLYLNDIGKYALLTKDAEARLAQAVEAGRQARGELAGAEGISPSRQRELRRLIRDGDQATETFVKANLRLVVSIAKKYQAAGLPLLDLVQEGNLGLIHAVEKFDWRKGFKFSTYATWWIRQAITRGMANSGRTVRLPVHAGDLLNRTIKARGRLEGQLGRRPTIAELAADLEVPEERVTDILRHVAEPLSLSEPLRDDGDAELGDVVADQAAVSPFDAAAVALLARRGRQDAGGPRRAGAGDPPAALRPGPGPAPHLGRSWRVLQPDPGADPPDRGPSHVQAAPPLPRPRRPRAAQRLGPSQGGRSSPGGRR